MQYNRCVIIENDIVFDENVFVWMGPESVDSDDTICSIQLLSNLLIHELLLLPPHNSTKESY